MVVGCCCWCVTVFFCKRARSRPFDTIKRASERAGQAENVPSVTRSSMSTPMKLVVRSSVKPDTAATSSTAPLPLPREASAYRAALMPAMMPWAPASSYPVVPLIWPVCRKSEGGEEAEWRRFAIHLLLGHLPTPTLPACLSKAAAAATTTTTTAATPRTRLATRPTTQHETPQTTTKPNLLTRSFIHSLTHSLSRSLTRSLTHQPKRVAVSASS